MILHNLKFEQDPLYMDEINKALKILIIFEIIYQNIYDI